MPSRDDGFAIMDVSTSICDDPKFRRLARENPEMVAPAFTAYVATMAESWRVGRRVPVEDAWPGFLPFSEPVCDALRGVGLIDARGLLTVKAWRGWFEPARERRQKSRDRWTRYNANRTGDTTHPPRGSDVDTATSVPTVRPSVPTGPSVPSVGARGRREAKHDDGLSTQRTREEALHELSEQFRRGELDEVSYQRQRKALGATA